MNIQIEIINVGDVQKKEKYSTYEIVYRDIGKEKVGTKKLMSFAYPLVYNGLKGAQKGEKYNVTLVKEGEYWQWTEFSVPGLEAPMAQQEAPPSAAKNYVKGSNYETSEERAARQTSIIRQSSISNAIAALKVDKQKIDSDELFAYAAKIEDWVTRKPGLHKQIEETFTDDFPE
jgi:hypothetical protein